MIESYLAAKEHKKNLVNDQIRLTEKLKNISGAVKNLRKEKEQASFELDQCEKQFIRDQITAADLEAARDVFKKAEEKQVSAERLHALATDELDKLDRDLLEVQGKIKSSRNRFATAERESLAKAINQDTKLRSRLLEIYAAQLVYNNFSTPFWPDFLASIFSHPAEAESKESVIKFKRKHGLD